MVSGLPGQLSAKVAVMSMAGRCAVLTGVVAGVFAVAAPIAWARLGGAGLVAASIAALVCLVAALVGMMLTIVGRRTSSPTSWFLAGDIVAMGLPLIAAYTIYQSGGPSAEAGILMWTVLFFLTALIVKTCLIAPHAAGFAKVGGEAIRGKARA